MLSRLLSRLKPHVPRFETDRRRCLSLDMPAVARSRVPRGVSLSRNYFVTVRVLVLMPLLAVAAVILRAMLRGTWTTAAFFSCHASPPEFYAPWCGEYKKHGRTKRRLTKAGASVVTASPSHNMSKEATAIFVGMTSE